MRHERRWIFAALVLGTLVARAEERPRYIVVPLGSLGGASSGNGINDLG